MACTFGEREVEERREEMKRRVYSRDEGRNVKGQLWLVESSINTGFGFEFLILSLYGQ